MLPYRLPKTSLHDFTGQIQNEISLAGFLLSSPTHIDGGPTVFEAACSSLSPVFVLLGKGAAGHVVHARQHVIADSSLFEALRSLNANLASLGSGDLVLAKRSSVLCAIVARSGICLLSFNVLPGSLRVSAFDEFNDPGCLLQRF